MISNYRDLEAKKNRIDKTITLANDARAFLFYGMTK